MKLKFNTKNLSVVILLFIACNFTFAQGWQWAKNAGGLNNDAGRAVCTDPSGNVIVAGGFAAPSVQIGTVTVNSLGSGDIYIAKYDPSGNLIWIQTIGGTGLEVVGGVCTATNGNIYVSGSYDSPVLTASTYTLGQASTVGNMDIFMVAYNSGGACIWAKKYGTAANEHAGEVTYSASNSNVYMTGYYSGTTFTIGASNLTNSGAAFTNDLFIGSFNSVFGTPNWAVSTGASNSSDMGYSVGSDATGNLYVGGTFAPTTGSTSVIGAAVTSLGGQDVFVAKYNNAGTFQWVRTGGAASVASSDYFTGLDMDALGNCYISGAYTALPMTIGTATLANAGSNDAFIAKYNSAGTFQWARSVSAAGVEFGYDVTVDGNNNPYLAGYFGGTVVAVGAYTLTNSNPGTTQDIFVVKYNSAGTPQWVTSAAGANNETIYGAAADAIGNVYVTGAYNITGPITFGTAGTLSSAGNNDGFVAKIGCITTTISGSSNVCAGASATLTAGGGATSFTWNTGATTSSIVITPTSTTSYSVYGAAGTCYDGSNQFTVTLLPRSVSAGPDISLLCGQSQLIPAVCNPPSPTGVTWTPAAGLSSSSVLTPTANPSNNSQQYIVSVTLNNGCTAQDTIVVSRYAPKPDICMVSVDSLNQYNEIYWDETAYPTLDSMIIYREVSTNVYKRIGAVSKTALSYFSDTLRSIGPSNGDPNITTYRYRIQMRDNCGNYSAQSYWHNTVYFNHTGGNFFWSSNYMIETATVPSNPVLTYSLMVCPNPSVSPTYTLVGITAGNQFNLNDPNYSTYQTTADWRVFGDLGYSCTATLKTATAKIGKSRSNIQNNRFIGIKEVSLKNRVKVYPNPAHGILNVDFEDLNEDVEINLVNVLGQIVYAEKISKAMSIKTIDISGFSKGVYTLNLSGKAQYKVVVE